jgi:uncharacterized protein (DUF1697 family)
MTIYIALLRGVNVGGKNKVGMAELKLALSKAGLSKVQTYIQSGNVAFESADSTESLRPLIEQEILDGFGVASTVILRTAEEWKDIIARCPYATDALPEGWSIQLSALTERPTQAHIDILAAGIPDTDDFTIVERDIYFLFRQSVLDSKLARNLQKLGNSVTSRNWNTVLKLDAMVDGMKSRRQI